MRNPISLTAAVISVLSAASLLHADVVQINDGSRLVGEITSISGGIIYLETAYAGTLEIPFEQITTFSSEDTESLRLANGTVAVGSVSSRSDGSIAVATSGGTITASPSDVVAAWAPGERDPEALAREVELESQLRKWAYEVAVGISGKSGNTSKSDFSGSAAATLEGPNDRLRLYTTYQYAKTDSATTSDEIIGGMSYTSYFSEYFGWYVREELERDRFENIAFRSTTAAGLNYRVFKEPKHALELTGGLAIRYEGYDIAVAGDDGVLGTADDVTSDSFPGLDFGLKHYLKFADWGEINTIVTYNPAFEDFGDYRIDHLSALDIPLGTADYWKFRVSLQNQYNSNPTGNLDNLDTTYALSLLLNWK